MAPQTVTHVLVRHRGPDRRVVLPVSEAARLERLERVARGTGPLSDLFLAQSAIEAAHVRADRAATQAADTWRRLWTTVLIGVGAIGLATVVAVLVYVALHPSPVS